jgi:predicted transcriptional regulator
MPGNIIPSAAADFLVRLRKIDLHGLTHRDVIILYTIIKTPGSSGIEVADKIGLKNRSSVALNITRLIRCGFIEDRREMARKASPAVLHALQPGIDFWNEIKPE